MAACASTLAIAPAAGAAVDEPRRLGHEVEARQDSAIASTIPFGRAVGPGRRKPRRPGRDDLDRRHRAAEDVEPEHGGECRHHVGEGDHAEETHRREDHELAGERQSPDASRCGRREERERQADDRGERRARLSRIRRTCRRDRPPRGQGWASISSSTLSLNSRTMLMTTKAATRKRGATAEQGCDNRCLDVRRLDDRDLLQEAAAATATSRSTPTSHSMRLRTASSSVARAIESTTLCHLWQYRGGGAWHGICGREKPKGRGGGTQAARSLPGMTEEHIRSGAEQRGRALARCSCWRCSSASTLRRSRGVEDIWARGLMMAHLGLFIDLAAVHAGRASGSRRARPS